MCFNGLEPAELQILLALREHPNATVTTLAETLELARPSVSNAIKTLHMRSYVGECRSDVDGRLHMQSLTSQGHALVDSFLSAGSADGAAAVHVIEIID